MLFLMTCENFKSFEGLLKTNLLPGSYLNVKINIVCENRAFLLSTCF